MLITIQQFTIPSENLADGDYILRLWYNQSFLDSSGQAVASGTGTTGTYLTADATVGGGFITFDPFTVYSTLDALTPNPQAIQISCQLFKRNNALPIFPFHQISTPATWIVPDDLGATISFEEWTIANQRISLYYAQPNWYTAAQVDALIAANNTQVAFNQDFVITEYASLAAAITAITPTGGTLVINEATTCTDDLTVPSTITLRFTRKGSITISTGKLLAINGPIEADPVKIFYNATAGLGTVSLLNNTTIDAVPAQWWADFPTEIIDRSAGIQAAITCIGLRGGWVDFSDFFAISTQLEIPNNVGLRGAGSQNSRRGGLTALAPFSGDFMAYVSNDVPTPNSSAFDNFLSGMNLNAKNIANLGAIKNKTWQENSGPRNCVIQGFTTYGIFYEGGGGGAATSIIYETEIFAGGSGATAGVEVSSGVSDGLIVLMIGGGISGDFSTAAFNLVKASLNCVQVHFEESTTGILLDGVGNSVLTSVSGGSGMTNLVRIAAGFTGSMDMFGCQRNGATYLLRDSRVAVPGLIPFDLITTDDPTVTLASIGASFRANGSNRIIGDLSLIGENANNMALYKTTNTSTQVIELIDSLNTSANRLTNIIGTDINGSVTGFSNSGNGGVFVWAIAAGTGTARDVIVGTTDAKSVILATTNLERLRVTATGNVGIGGTPNTNAILDLQSTTKPFMPPRMSTAQRDAVSSPTAGMVIYNTSTNKLNVYTTGWEQVTSA